MVNSHVAAVRDSDAGDHRDAGKLATNSHKESLEITSSSYTLWVSFISILVESWATAPRLVLAGTTTTLWILAGLTLKAYILAQRIGITRSYPNSYASGDLHPFTGHWRTMKMIGVMTRYWLPGKFYLRGNLVHQRRRACVRNQRTPHIITPQRDLIVNDPLKSKRQYDVLKLQYIEEQSSVPFVFSYVI